MDSVNKYTANIDDILQRRQVRPTANRIAIFRELLNAGGPLSMAELEERLVTIDKSGLSRALGLFASRHLVHVIEDGSGAAKYEACQGHSDHSIDDMHPHFHCEGCGVTVCLDDTPVPLVSVPDGYEVYSVNYVIKGLCGVCASKYNG